MAAQGIMSKDVTPCPVPLVLSPTDAPVRSLRFAMPETVVHFQIRMPPALHENLASRAREEKTSLNALVVSILQGAAERHEAGQERMEPESVPAR